MKMDTLRHILSLIRRPVSLIGSLFFLYCIVNSAKDIYSQKNGDQIFTLDIVFGMILFATMSLLPIICIFLPLIPKFRKVSEACSKALNLYTAVVISSTTLVTAGILLHVLFSGDSDKSTLAQKKQDALEQKYKDYRELKKEYPSIELDGKIVPVEIIWSSNELTIAMPPTYGFGATRFIEKIKTISKAEFKQLSEEFEENYFMSIGVKIWIGPSESIGSFSISIPKAVIPNDFLKSPKQQASGTFTCHGDSINQYSIIYPSTWEILHNDLFNRFKEQLQEGSQLLVAIGGENGNLIMQVIKEKSNETCSLQELYESRLSNSALPQTIVSKDNLSINDLSAIKAVSVYTLPNGKPAKTMSLLLLRDGYLWVVLIGGHPKSFDASRADIDSIANSLTFASQDRKEGQP